MVAVVSETKTKAVLNMGFINKDEMYPIYSNVISQKLDQVKNPYNIPVRGDTETKYFKIHRNLGLAENPCFLANLVSRYIINNRKLVKESPYHTFINDLYKIENTIYILKKLVEFIEEAKSRKKIEIYDENKNPIEIVFRKYIVKNYTDSRTLDLGKMKYKYTTLADNIILNRLIADYSHLVNDKLLTKRKFDIRIVLNKNSRIRLATIKIFKDTKPKDKTKYIFKVILVEDI